MKLSALQEDLSRSLSFVSRFVSPRAQLPVLTNILFEAKKGRLRLAATNLEMGISYEIGAKVEKEGSTTVPAKLAVELASALPAGRINLEEKGGQLSFFSAGFSGELATIPASEFPKVPSSAGEKRISLKKETLSALSQKVAFAASTDDSRPALTGVLLLLGEEAKAVATDGFRLSYKELEGEKGKQEEKILVPARAIEEMARLLGEGDEKVEVSFLGKEGQVLFSSGGVVLTSRLLEGEFPDFEKIMPGQTGNKARADAQELLAAVKAAAIFAREEANILRIRFLDGKLVINAESQQYGKEEVVVDAKTEGEEVEVALNYRYLLDFLGSVEGEEVVFGINSSTSPGLFQDGGDPAYRHLIMPVRIQS